MSEIYLLIIEDRHADVEVEAYRTEAGARQAADEYRRGLIEWKGRDEWEELELSDEMIKSGWLLNVSYSSESDYVRIQRVALHE